MWSTRRNILEKGNNVDAAFMPLDEEVFGLAIAVEDVLWLCWKALKAGKVTAAQLLPLLSATKPTEMGLGSAYRVRIVSMQLTDEGHLQGELRPSSSTERLPGSGADCLPRGLFLVSEHGNRIVDEAEEPAVGWVMTLTQKVIGTLVDYAQVLPKTAALPKGRFDLCPGVAYLDGLLVACKAVESVLENREGWPGLVELIREHGNRLDVFWQVEFSCDVWWSQTQKNNPTVPSGSSWTARLVVRGENLLLNAQLASITTSSLEGLCAQIGKMEQTWETKDEGVAKSWYSTLLLAGFLITNPSWCVAEADADEGVLTRCADSCLVPLFNAFCDDSSWLTLVNCPDMWDVEGADVLADLAQFRGPAHEGVALLTRWASEQELHQLQC